MSSYSITESITFSITHARHIAAKVATDLSRMAEFYGVPDSARIDRYEAEIIEFLKAGYLDTVTYGFQRDGNWIPPTLRYTAKDLLWQSASDDPGRVKPNENVSGAIFKSYLTYSPAWNALSAQEQAVFEAKLPFKRVGTDEPGVKGYFDSDKTYSAGGKALDRATLRSY